MCCSYSFFFILGWLRLLTAASTSPGSACLALSFLWCRFDFFAISPHLIDTTANTIVRAALLKAA